MTVYARPGTEGSLMSFQIAATTTSSAASGCRRSEGQYFENPTPVTGQTFCEVARSDEADIEQALDAAHAAAPAWGKTSAGRARGDPQQDRRPHRGEPRVDRRRRDRGTTASRSARRLTADIPLAVDHFRYFAGAIRAQEGSLSPDRRRHRRLPLPRAAGRGRPDHPVELPDPDGDLEAGTRAGRGQRGGAQAGRADPGLDPVPDVADRRPAARRACSTSSTASASRRASRWRRATGSPRSRSPARPPPAG